MVKVVRPVTETKPKKVKPEQPREVVQQRPIRYPEIRVNGVVIPEKNLRISVAKAKELLGWETEADYEARKKKADPKISDSACKFGDEFLLTDYEGNKVRCWHNAHNRPFTKSWAEAICQDILNHKWKLNCETIIISKTAVDLSGQHRLVGLVLAGQKWAGKTRDFWQKKWEEEPYILSLVVTGASEDQEVVNTLDNVRPRSLSDIFYTMDTFAGLAPDLKEESCNMTAQAIKFLWDRTNPSRDATSELVFKTQAAYLEFFDRHKRIAEFVKHIFNLNRRRELSKDPIQLNPGVCAGIAYLMATSSSDLEAYIQSDPPSEKVLEWANEEKALKFFEELSKNEPPLRPVRAGLKSLATREEDGEEIQEKVPSLPKICLLSKAWGLYLNDQPITPEGVIPRYSYDEDGNREDLIEKDLTFGEGENLGIDYGHPLTDKQRGEITRLKKENPEGRPPTPEEVEREKAAIREENRKAMEEKVKKNAQNVRGGEE